ncbi:MAG: peroxiredoxin [Myxococcales bacterium]|nr:peroxiredoxin [Myxococcales bacterium]MCB9643203.1 peroxiredoxin [Myxococcales bacterium]
MKKKGDQLPDFSFKTSAGETYRLSELKDRNGVIFFFYPGDFTPGCTKEVCYFRDSFGDLQQEGAAIFGISLDSDEKHEKFREAYQLPFALIADHDKSLSKTFGVLRLGGFLKVRRATFVVDPKKMEIAEAFSNEFNMHVHAERALEIVKVLKGAAA